MRLGGHLPRGASLESQGNRVELDVASDATPLEVMQGLGLSTDRNYLVKVNGAIVPVALSRPGCLLAVADHVARSILEAR